MNSLILIEHAQYHLKAQQMQCLQLSLQQMIFQSCEMAAEEN